MHTSRPLEVILWGSSHKAAETGPAVGLLPFYGPDQLSSCNGPSPGIFSTLLRLCWETQQMCLLAKACMDVPSWRSWTTCATWMGCRYCLILALVTRAQAKCKTIEKSVRKDMKGKWSVASTCKTISFLGVVLLLSTFCRFHLHQSRWNWFTISYTFLQDRSISQKCFTVMIKCSLHFFEQCMIFHSNYIFNMSYIILSTQKANLTDV